MVPDDSCGPPGKPVTAVEPPDGTAELSDALAGAGPKPIGCDVDGLVDVLDEVSDLMASSAADAAPRANSMAELQQDRPMRPRLG